MPSREITQGDVLERNSKKDLLQTGGSRILRKASPIGDIRANVEMTELDKHSKQNDRLAGTYPLPSMGSSTRMRFKLLCHRSSSELSLTRLSPEPRSWFLSSIASIAPRCPALCGVHKRQVENLA